MNLEPVGHPVEPSTHAVALLFGGYTRTHPVRQHLGFPWTFQKLLLHPQLPFPRESVGPVTAFSSHSARSFWSRENSPSTWCFIRLRPTQEPQITALGNAMNCWYWVAPCARQARLKPASQSSALLSVIACRDPGLLIPNTPQNYSS